MLKAKPSYKNVDLNGTGIPPSTLIFNLSLCRYYKFLWSKCKGLCLNKVVQSFWVVQLLRLISNKIVDKSFKVITNLDDLKILFPGNTILEENSGTS